MMKFLEKPMPTSDEMVGLCMGEQGIISRVLGVRAGSIFTFAALQFADEETAPGQVAEQASSAMSIASSIVDQATQVYGVAGDRFAFAFASNDECGIPPRERECGLPGAPRQKLEGPLERACSEIPIRGLTRDHAVQTGNPGSALITRTRSPTNWRM